MTSIIRQPAPPSSRPPPKPRSSGSAGTRRSRRWTWRDALSAAIGYLPVLLMGLLALGTYWLVRNTPVPEPERPPGPARGEPDYEMQRFAVQRFGPDGALRAQIAGDRLRHYPDTDTLLIDRPRVRTVDAQNRVTRAEAERAQSNGDASELVLEGSARVVREAHGDEPATEVVGEEIRASREAGRIVSRQPVTVTRASSVLRADAMVYDQNNQVVTLTGRVRATLSAGAAGSPGGSGRANPAGGESAR